MDCGGTRNMRCALVLMHDGRTSGEALSGDAGA